MTLQPADIDAIRAAGDALAQAFDADDPTAWVDSSTDDAVLVSVGSPAVEAAPAVAA
jgi:ketosteroid isomerase-like protein